MDIDQDIEATDSTEDSDEFTNQRQTYMTKSRKRQLDLNEAETSNRERRFKLYQEQLRGHLETVAKNGRERGRRKFHEGAMAEVMAKEDEDEKERKKEQQRKRRREKAEVEKKLKAEMAVKAAKEVAAQAPGRHDRDEQPPLKIRKVEKPPVFEENIMDLSVEGPDSDVSGVPVEEETITRRIRKKPGPKKKLPPPSPSVPVEEPVIVAKAPEPIPKEEYVPHTSKTYTQLYEQIWKDIARKEIPKLHRTQQASLATKQANHRKTAQLAAKEAQRWKLRTTKNIKDTQARAKRSMREMLSFWKRNEREERDMRRRAEKEAMERAKKEEEARESMRQARKLNFLLTQTELYSHFVGNKIRTDAIEKSTGSDAVAVPAATSSKQDMAQQMLAMEGKQSGSAVNFEDLDFDDEEALKQAAAANAHHHFQATKNAARAFNQPGGSEGGTMDPDEEMDFQNPAGMDDVEIEQPKMLNCTLKEYQLKGLNWLSNLYEQGINGILADEMGLGKTVQSISVMAYLAERHNIWGPFLVIAPSSTLHNWQQEISRFVPDFKVIPYWGGAKDRKILRKFWDRKTPVYTKDSPFHVLITSYQLVVQDAANFSQMKWQYMILDEAQAIKSSSSTRWKALLGFHCRNRLLLTGTPIQNSMQELWALLHFIMPSLFDSHDEFSEWFSKDIESHAQSNTQLNEKQLERLHMILKPFMLRRVKKHVQKELGDKIEKDVFCELTYRQRALYRGLRDKISFMDLIEKAAAGDDNNQTLMNLVMQFRKVCNHPDLFERADVRSPLALTSYSETGSFLREGPLLQVPYTARSLINYRVPCLVYRYGGRLDLPGSDSNHGSRNHLLATRFNIWRPDCIKESINKDRDGVFSWLRFSDTSVGEASKAFHHTLLDKFESLRQKQTARFSVVYDEDESWEPWYARLLVTDFAATEPVATATKEGVMASLLKISEKVWVDERFNCMDPLTFRAVSAPPINLLCNNQGVVHEQENLLFNERTRRFLFGPNSLEDEQLLENKVDPADFLPPPMLPRPSLERLAVSHVQVPSMGRFVSDSGKLAELDRLLTELKVGGHRVLLYFQMTRMMDLCEEYLTYRHHRYLRLDGSSKLEDRRDMVDAWQTNPDIFVFILSTRAGGLGINLTAADTVIFYDSDWNPTIDSQAMDRAHRLGQTRQVRVFRLITRGTIEERIRQRAQQKEEVQRVVIQGGDPGAKKSVDFKGTREVATWLFDKDEAEALETALAAKEKELEEQKAKAQPKTKAKKKKVAAAPSAPVPAVDIEDMYHEGEGRFDDSGKPSEAETPGPASGASKKRAKGKTNKKKTTQERLNMIDGNM
ncbi:SNF2 family N-terminal domain-containing protein [Tricharina praecox]|uniref:SNF2 family N-terminal domain-containing protein n=1 Tax=Tricharina praecox TaxID=43433 RepID=UPI00221E861E|nr:SNF2 family N-terminal domain-containing protein [Tricharina praecox]KAI5854565.1 SNF2 family N-terminal domain-containing protein [Tricharina praecox]